MKLAVATCFHGREETTRRFVAHWTRLREELRGAIELDLVAAVSRELGGAAGYLRRVGVRGGNFRVVEAANRPLQRKFGAAVHAAWSPDAAGALLLGADDFADRDYVLWAAQVACRHELGGVREAWIVCSESGRVARWTGYDGERAGEPVGAGRVISRSLLDAWEWDPWPACGDYGLDGALWRRAREERRDTVVATLEDVGMLVDVKDRDSLTTFSRLIEHPRVREVDATEWRSLCGWPW